MTEPMQPISEETISFEVEEKVVLLHESGNVRALTQQRETPFMKL